MKRFAAALLAATMLAGCGGPYTIRGRIVDSRFNGVAFIPADDPRLESEPGLGGAEVKIYRDPDRLKMHLAGRALADAEGRFVLPVEGFGAGWMVEQWRIQAGRAGYQTADTTMPLPGADRDLRLLIMLSPGPSTPLQGGSDELWEQYRRYR